MQPHADYQDGNEDDTYQLLTEPFRKEVVHIWLDFIPYGLTHRVGLRPQTVAIGKRFWDSIYDILVREMGTQNLLKVEHNQYEQCRLFFEKASTKDALRVIELSFQLMLQFGQGNWIPQAAIENAIDRLNKTFLRHKINCQFIDGKMLCENDIPPWALELRLGQAEQLENEKRTLQAEIDELDQLLALVYATGDPLEDAVLLALSKYLGLMAWKMERGSTIDIQAHSADKSFWFGLEVTGINGPLSKNSNKLTQVTLFEREKQNNEKIIIIANTHRMKPVSERGKLEHFSGPVLQYFRSSDVLLMTGVDLLRMIHDVLESNQTQEEIVRILYESNGMLDYP